jgi:hypothetical protein
MDWQTDVPLTQTTKVGATPGFWRLSKIGNSKFFPLPTSALQQVSKAGKKYGKKFTARTVREGGVQGVRVWRIA